MDTTSQRVTAAFERHVHRALRGLFTPLEVSRSPLISLLGLGDRRDPRSALRTALTEAIEALKPGDDAPPQSNAWRIYQILSQRYAEQFTQHEVAASLALSTRQLARLERQAIRVLADHLWNRYDVASRIPSAQEHPPQASVAVQQTDTPSRETELQWLMASCPRQPAICQELVEAALRVAAPLAHALGVSAECCLPVDLPQLAVQLTTMHQALLNAFTAAIRSVPGGLVRIEAHAGNEDVQLRVLPTPAQGTNPCAALDAQHDCLEVASDLAQLSGGAVEVSSGERNGQPAQIRIVLPVLEKVTVLVIDDNADTLQLLERYLGGSRYRFVGTTDPQHSLALAEECGAQIVVLDVMLPGMDGWELLARFREHPRLGRAPIIACTILPQEDLAVMLGAAALIRKPVTQMAFLATLDQQMEKRAKAEC